MAGVFFWCYNKFMSYFSKKTFLVFSSLATFAQLSATNASAQVGNNAATLSSLNQVFASVISILLSLIGAVSVVVLIMGGFQFLSAAGNKESINKASSTFTYAFLGLTLSVSAWMILNLLSKFLGVNNLTVFNICITACP